MPGYVSPLDTYKNRASPPVRYHVFPQADGRTQLCSPRYCREHWREKNWTSDGQ